MNNDPLDILLATTTKYGKFQASRDSGGNESYCSSSFKFKVMRILRENFTIA